MGIIMWLSDRDERKLLKILFLRAYSRLQKGTSPVEPIQYTYRDLVAAFRPKAAVEKDYIFATDVGRITDKKVIRFTECISQIYALIIMLEERSLLKLLEGQITTEGGTKQRHGSAMVFCFTPKGYDLGRKYSRRYLSLHLWWIEYKDSFIWPLIGYFLGIASAVVVYLIVNRLTNGTSQ